MAVFLAVLMFSTRSSVGDRASISAVTPSAALGEVVPERAHRELEAPLGEVDGRGVPVDLLRGRALRDEAVEGVGALRFSRVGPGDEAPRADA